ncbi:MULTISPECIES: UDP-N-acetylmuramoyl-L-alanine--D-glutamate ligase [Bacillaceae]|uniref:UDP-N-acetylmuramoylalanine--D-glutamate ligase n=1 Tax=Evansella alkalicola TaxID=745819 RepID=A0ABS6JPF7_9BACI|nr:MULTISPECIES: UDP-N-acetylmuramoyl-L-alanine--D-glutamate ligase [Bacillaceae]MBU9720443.1 UDP-N-acetylmuramoyl-L-alanine--D-glutamate ligase [Bacillus alkalicola]
MRRTNAYEGKHVLVLGLAKSGSAAAELLIKQGAIVTVNDQKPFEENEEAQKLSSLGAEVVCGSHPLDLIHTELSLLVKNPGIRYDNPLVEKAVSLNVPVITEVELAYQISEADIIGITGSNGKTTTTTYIYEMLKGGEKEPFVAGNIGEVSCEVAQQVTEENVMVTELSSFQLMGIQAFRPKVALLLNIVEAHLDYHGDLINYIHAKGNIFKNQTQEDYLIYNADDVDVSELVTSGQASAKLIPFSTTKYVSGGACIHNNQLEVFGEPLLHVEEMSLPGEHNIANGLAAAAAALLSGAKRERVIEVLKSFRGVEHRLQYVATHDGRKFYNNSKATNVPATITALKAFEQPIVLIAGGLDRGLSFDGLIPYFNGVKSVVAYGETAEKIGETAKKAGIENIHLTKTLDQAVPMAFEQSKEGDVILLSPACASWDQFKTFEERGDHFVNAVKKIGQ